MYMQKITAGTGRIGQNSFVDGGYCTEFHCDQAGWCEIFENGYDCSEFLREPMVWIQNSSGEWVRLFRIPSGAGGSVQKSFGTQVRLFSVLLGAGGSVQNSFLERVGLFRTSLRANGFVWNSFWSRWDWPEIPWKCCSGFISKWAALFLNLSVSRQDCSELLPEQVEWFKIPFGTNGTVKISYGADGIAQNSFGSKWYCMRRVHTSGKSFKYRFPRTVFFFSKFLCFFSWWKVSERWMHRIQDAGAYGTKSAPNIWCILCLVGGASEGVSSILRLSICLVMLLHHNTQGVQQSWTFCEQQGVLLEMW